MVCGVLYLYSVVYSVHSVLVYSACTVQCTVYIQCWCTVQCTVYSVHSVLVITTLLQFAIKQGWAKFFLLKAVEERT